MSFIIIIPTLTIEFDFDIVRSCLRQQIILFHLFTDDYKVMSPEAK